MNHVTEIFGSMVFDDATMKEKLPRDVYKALKKTIEIGKSLDPGVANTVANAKMCIRDRNNPARKPSRPITSSP